MPGRGGARAGAGRKTNAEKLLQAQFVCEYFDELAQAEFWKSKLQSEDERISLEAGKYITDRLYGKAPQALDLNHSGEVEVIKRVVADL